MFICKYWEPGNGFSHEMKQRIKGKTVLYVGAKSLCVARYKEWKDHAKICQCFHMHTPILNEIEIAGFDMIIVENVQFNMKTRVAQVVTDLVNKFVNTDKDVIVRLDERECRKIPFTNAGFVSIQQFKDYYSIFNKPLFVKPLTSEPEGMKSNFIPQIRYKSVGQQDVWKYEFIDVTFVDDFGSEAKGRKCKKLVFNFVDGTCDVYCTIDSTHPYKRMNIRIKN